MKKFWTMLLAVLLLCSVVLNIYLVTKEPSDPVLSDVPADPTGDTQASADDTPTLVELEMIKSMISTSLFGLRGRLNRQWFMTDSSYQRVYDLVYNLYACGVDTDRRVIKVEFINLTDEMIETFDMIFRNEDYIEIINLGEGIVGSYGNTMGGVSSDPTEAESPSAEELYMVQNSISYALALLRDIPKEHFEFASGYADVNALASSYCGGHVDTENDVVVIEIRDLTDEKIETFKMLFSDAEYIVFEDYELTTGSPVG